MNNIFKKIFIVFPVSLICRVRNWMVVWRLLNWKGRNAFLASPPSLNEAQRRILEDLKLDGIAISHLEELFPEENLLPRLKGYAEKLLPKAQAERAKYFLHFLWERRSGELGLTNPFLPFVLNPIIINTVNSYFGFFTKLYYFMLALTTPILPGNEEVASQRWHRDPEDKMTCKIFLYLTDVDEESGPFIYTKGSHYGGKYGKLFPCPHPKGVYISNEDIDRAVAKSDIKVCTGRAGTVIFCDTTGLHKGGYATKKERMMFTGGYHSSAGIRFIRLRLSEMLKTELSTLSPAARYALTPLPKKFISLAFFKFKKSFESAEYD